jgi:hypothetical protein
MPKWAWVIVIVSLLGILTVGILWALGVFSTANSDPESQPDSNKLQDHDVPELKSNTNALSIDSEETTRVNPVSPPETQDNTPSLQFGRFVIHGNEMMVSGSGHSQVFLYVFEQGEWQPKATLKRDEADFGTFIDFNDHYAIIGFETGYFWYNRHGDTFELEYREEAKLNGTVKLYDSTAYLGVYPRGVLTTTCHGRQQEIELIDDIVNCFGTISDVVVAGTDHGMKEIGGTVVFASGNVSSFLETEGYIFIGNAIEETITVIGPDDTIVSTVMIPGKTSVNEKPSGFGMNMSFFDKYLLVSAPFENVRIEESGMCCVYEFNADSPEVLQAYDVIFPPKPISQGHFGMCVDYHAGHWVISQDSTDQHAGECFRFPLDTVSPA